MAKSPAGIAAIDCCPPLEPCDVCDYLDFTFRLPFNPSSMSRDGRMAVPGVSIARLLDAGRFRSVTRRLQ